MNNYNQENTSDRRMTRDRFRGKRTGGRRFDRRNQGRSDMFPATCDECGKSCQVPFRPTSGKPIYCSDCFESKGGRGGERLNRRNFGRQDFGNRHGDRYAMHQAICNECGKNCEVPFQPTPGKPIFCNECFADKGKARDRFAKSGVDETEKMLKVQFDNLNAKMDKILSYLEQDTTSNTIPKENVLPKKQQIKEIKSRKTIKKTAPKKSKSSLKDEGETKQELL